MVRIRRENTSQRTQCLTETIILLLKLCSNLQYDLIIQVYFRLTYILVFSIGYNKQANSKEVNT